MKKTLVFILIVTFSLQTAINGSTSVSSDVSSTVDMKSCKSKTWIKYDTGILRFCGPPNLETIEISCIHSDCYQFKNNQLTITFEGGIYISEPTWQSELPGYLEEDIQVDGIDTLIWHYENNGFYQSRARFTFEKNEEYAVGIFVDSENTNVHDIAEEIFKSVKFKDNVKKRR